MSLKLHPNILAGVVCVLLTLIPFVLYYSVFSMPTDMDEYAQKYANSQYIKGDASPLKITDGELYVYAGYAYVQGEDPTTINFEHPPLVKYVFGVSYLLFGNSFILSLVLYVLFLWSFYVFTGLVVKSQLLRYGALIILGLQPVSYILASQTLLDVPLNMLVLLLFYVLFREGGAGVVMHGKRHAQMLVQKYVLLGVILGLLSSVKYPFPFMLLPFGLVGVSGFIKKESKFFLISLLIAPMIYLAQYAVYFAHGHSLFDFLQFEKYRLSWWTGDRTMPKFLIFQNLFTGQFPAWWEENLMVKSEEWNVFLPLLFVGHLVGMGYVLVGLVDRFKLKMKAISVKSKQLKTVCDFVEENLVQIAICLYSLTLILLYGFGAAVYLRYLTQLLPFWIVVCVVGVERFLDKNSVKRVD